MNLAILICSCASIFGQTIILICVLAFKQLRSELFPRIIVYLTISTIVQTLGIVISVTDSKLCVYFAVLRLYGGLSCILWSIVMMWCIGQLFTVLIEGGQFVNLKLKQIYLEEQEIKLLLICFGVPLILILWPIFTNSISGGFDQLACYLYSNRQEGAWDQFQTDMQKVILWELPIIVYLIYSISVLIKIKRIFEDDDSIIVQEVSKVIKSLLLFPIITLICTIGFTVQDTEAIFYIYIPKLELVISLCLLSLWGFLNCVAYLSQETVRDVINQSFRITEDVDQDQLLINDENSSRMSLDSSNQEYFYRDWELNQVAQVKSSILQRQLDQVNNAQLNAY